MSNNHQHILFVINPISGDIDKDETTAQLKKQVEENGYTFNVFHTTGEDDFIKLSKVIDEISPTIVVAVGGDGTCNLVGTALKDVKVRMGIVPAGSANGMARALAIPNKIDDSLRIIFNGNTKYIDLVKVNQRYSLHLSDVGLNARIIRKYEKHKKRGLPGYAQQFLKELFLIQSHKYKIIFNEKTIIKKALMVVMANANKYGTGAIINPNGKLDDGIFEIIVIKPYRSIGFLRIVKSFFTGNYEKIDFVEIYPVQHCRIINFDKQTLQIDGEIAGKPKIIDLEVLPTCLEIFVP